MARDFNQVERWDRSRQQSQGQARGQAPGQTKDRLTTRAGRQGLQVVRDPDGKVRFEGSIRGAKIQAAWRPKGRGASWTIVVDHPRVPRDLDILPQSTLTTFTRTLLGNDKHTGDADFDKRIVISTTAQVAAALMSAQTRNRLKVWLDRGVNVRDGVIRWHGSDPEADAEDILQRIRPLARLGRLLIIQERQVAVRLMQNGTSDPLREVRLVTLQQLARLEPERLHHRDVLRSLDQIAEVDELRAAVSPLLAEALRGAPERFKYLNEASLVALLEDDEWQLRALSALETKGGRLALVQVAKLTSGLFRGRQLKAAAQETAGAIMVRVGDPGGQLSVSPEHEHGELSVLTGEGALAMAGDDPMTTDSDD